MKIESALWFDNTTNEYCIICKTHGKVELDEETQSALSGLNHSIHQTYQVGCPKCTNESKQKEEEKNRKAKIHATRKVAGMPVRFRRVRLGGWDAKTRDQEKVLDTCGNYATHFGDALEEGTGMIFAGPPGTGKTHMACAVMNQVLDSGFKSLYTTGLGMKQAVQNTYSGVGESRQSVIKRHIHPDLLVIDEIDLLHASEDAQLIIWEVISGRYNEVKPTIIISNLNKQELTGVLGERIIDRLAENSGRFVAFDWKSHRRQK